MHPLSRLALAIGMIALGGSLAPATARVTDSALRPEPIQVSIDLKTVQIDYSGYLQRSVQVQQDLPLAFESVAAEPPQIPQTRFGYDVEVSKPGGCFFGSATGAGFAAAFSDEAKLKAARFHHVAGNFRQSLEALEPLTDDMPQAALAHYYRGLAYHQLERSQQALEHYERALELARGPQLQRESALAAAILAANQGLERYREHIDQYAEAVSAAAGSPDVVPVANYLLVRAALERRQFERLPSLVRRLQDTELHGAGLVLLGRAHQQQENPDAALEAYLQARLQGQADLEAVILDLALDTQRPEVAVDLFEQDASSIPSTSWDEVALAALRSKRPALVERAYDRIPRSEERARVAHARYMEHMRDGDASTAERFLADMVANAPAELLPRTLLLSARHWINRGAYIQADRALGRIDAGKLDAIERQQYQVFRLLCANARDRLLEAQQIVESGTAPERDSGYADIWHYQAALTWNRIGNLRQALAQYQQVNASSPYGPTSRFNAAAILAYQGDHERAGAMVEQLLEDDFAAVQRARGLLAAIRNAQGRFEDVLGIQGSGTRLRLEQSRAALKLGRIHQAERILGELQQQLDPQHERQPAILGLLAEAAFSRSDYERARQYLHQLLAHPRASTLQREDSRALLADIDYNTQQYQNALQNYRDLAGAIPAERLAEQNWFSGYVNTLILLDAADSLEHLLGERWDQIDPGLELSARTTLARAAMQQGDQERASRHLLALGDRQSLQRLLEFLAESGEAVEIQEILAENPELDSPDYAYYLGRAQEHNQQMSQAMAAYERVSAQAPWYEDANERLLRLSIAAGEPRIPGVLAHAERTGQTRMAVEALEVLIEQERWEPLQPIAKALLFTYATQRPMAGYAFARSLEASDPGKAILEHLKVTYLFPESPWSSRSLQRLAQLYEQTGQTDKAASVRARLNEGDTRD